MDASHIVHMGSYGFADKIEIKPPDVLLVRLPNAPKPLHNGLEVSIFLHRKLEATVLVEDLEPLIVGCIRFSYSGEWSMLRAMWSCYIVSLAPFSNLRLAQSPAVDSRKYRSGQIDIFALRHCPRGLDFSLVAVLFNLLFSQWPGVRCYELIVVQSWHGSGIRGCCLYICSANFMVWLAGELCQ